MKDLNEFIQENYRLAPTCKNGVFVIGCDNYGHLGLRIYSPAMMKAHYKNKVAEQLEHAATFTPIITLEEAKDIYGLDEPPCSLCGKFTKGCWKCRTPSEIQGDEPKQTGVNTISETIQFEYKNKFYILRIDSANIKPDEYRAHLYLCDSQLFLETFKTRDRCTEHAETFLKDGTK